MRVIPLLLLFLIAGRPAGAAQKSVTFYLDGARIEYQCSAVNGYLELPLPASMVAGSLRVKPAGNGRLTRVEIAPAERDARRAREIARLEEKKEALLARMQTLSRREEIFSAAAKAQSGRAPRKTKTNPDPVASLKQGTAFALAELDAVSRSRRSCQQALDALEKQLASAGKGCPVAKVWLTGGKATVSFLVGDQRWTPCYDFCWLGETGGNLLLHARLPRLDRQVRYFVSNGTVAQGAQARPVRDGYPVLASYPLALKSGNRSEQRPLSFTFDRLEAALPPGEAAAFWRGEYLGRGRFAGGGATELSIGNQ